MTDRTFDRVPEFDPRSRLFNIAALEPETPRAYTWSCAANLDQGSEGACVGFGWTHERAAKPKPDFTVANVDAFYIYKDAQRLDEWDGENYSGTSVLAGAKAAQRKGWIGQYRWAFNLMDALTGVSRHGPAVLGINWYTGMFDTDNLGYVRVGGEIAGGHAILMRGVDLKRRRVLLHNSWGPSWGGTDRGPGTAWITFEDLDRLLHEDGECCIPVERL